MRCPYCGYKEDKVVDSRATQEDSAIRRRRECLQCGKRFTTYEYIEELSVMVIKKDGRRQPFDRQKIMAGIVRACEKRPISVEKIEDTIAQVEHAIQKRGSREVESWRIGELLMDKLKKLDDVAYVRFASVYRQFRDVGQFMEELKGMLAKEKKPARRAESRSHNPKDTRR